MSVLCECHAQLGAVMLQPTWSCLLHKLIKPPDSLRKTLRASENNFSHMEELEIHEASIMQSQGHTMLREDKLFFPE